MISKNVISRMVPFSKLHCESVCHCLAMSMSRRVLLSVALCCALGLSTARNTDDDVTLDVDWGDFLSRHDLLWDWTWGAGGSVVLRTTFSDLDHCGPGGSSAPCCVVASTDHAVTLAECSPNTTSHQWLICEQQSVLANTRPATHTHTHTHTTHTTSLDPIRLSWNVAKVSVLMDGTPRRTECLSKDALLAPLPSSDCKATPNLLAMG